MPLGLKTPRRIDRNAASQSRVATLGQLAAISKIAKPQIFNLHDFCEGRGIVNFSDGHVLRSDARLIVRLQRRAMADMLLDLFRLSIAAGAEHARTNLDRPAPIKPVERVFANENGCSCTVADGCTHRECQ